MWNDVKKELPKKPLKKDDLLLSLNEINLAINNVISKVNSGMD